MTAELFNACVGGAVMTAWALHLGASTLVIGLLGALPLAAQVLQLPSAWLTHRLGYRRVAIAAIASSRVVWLPLAALPFVDLSAPARLQLYVTVFALAAILGVVGNNAWTAWMGDLVPSARRAGGRGRRHRGGQRRPAPAPGGSQQRPPRGHGLEVVRPGGAAA